MSNLKGQHSQQSDTAAASVEAQQRHRIAQLEEKLEVLKSGHMVKEMYGPPLQVGSNQTTTWLKEGQPGTLSLCSTILRTSSPKRTNDQKTTTMKTLPSIIGLLPEPLFSFHTSKLKGLVSKWVDQEFKPDPPVNPNDKHSHGFTNDVCGRLLCSAKLDWNDPVVRVGIQDHPEGHVVTDLSFPTYLYEKYTTNPDNLKKGFFKSKILIQEYKAVFISLSSTNDVEGDGDDIDIIQNNRHTRKASSFSTIKVQFALSSVTSWRSVDGNFNYVQFWQTIVDFFKKAPG
ncbi:hypothetical protein DFH29DRAFT_881706 [Suillus ampliporus]|nr:hypothetical protein DFH29DRAFT_881706 [Suillus ampliporus]